jgi:hypothetical protein
VWYTVHFEAWSIRHQLLLFVLGVERQQDDTQVQLCTGGRLAGHQQLDSLSQALLLLVASGVELPVEAP